MPFSSVTASHVISDATHIILMNAVASAQSKARSTEQLAIGRSHHAHKNVSWSPCLMHLGPAICIKTF